MMREKKEEEKKNTTPREDLKNIRTGRAPERQGARATKRQEQPKPRASDCQSKQAPDGMSTRAGKHQSEQARQRAGDDERLIAVECRAPEQVSAEKDRRG
jgi:hypothetical protein